ncbi:hypothetical protein EDB86DRAFT_2834703 [Lactarius hatsudake]|nr:hypothetical protein EDB86DRAFT_2834703 [Lactarius hatsudake]
MASLIEKHDRQLATASEPTGSPRRDELMDVNVSPPSHSPLSDGHASQGLLPFPGNVVNGVHEVAHVDLTNLSRAGLRELCDAFRLAKTRNKTMLTDRLKDFSADRQGWDGLLAGACKKHCGPRGGGVTKSTKGPGKKASTKKWLTLRRELLFSAATAASMGSTTQPCLPTERLKDMRTDEERAVVLADNFVVCNPYKPLEAENESSPPDVGRDWDGTARVHGDTSNTPSSPSPKGPQTALKLELQQVQAQLAALMAAIASGNGGGVAPSPVTVVSAPVPAPAHRGPGSMDSATTTTDTAATTTTTTDGPSPPTSSHQRPVSVLQGPLDYLKLGNSRSLCFEKQSVPDLPLVSFARDLPRLMRTWDDSSPKWTPSEAVLRIQGEPIALKHWPTVYRYGKSGQWACTKKNWAHWRDIATSWQELTETGFWQKFTADGQPMSYTAICEALKEERMAADHCLAEQAKDKYSDGFGAAFGYRRGSEHIVRNKSSAIARHYRSLHVSSD